MREAKKIVGWSAQIRLNGVETYITVQAGNERSAKKTIEQALAVGGSLLHVHETEMVSKKANLLAELKSHEMNQLRN